MVRSLVRCLVRCFPNTPPSKPRINKGFPAILVRCWAYFIQQTDDFIKFCHKPIAISKIMRIFAFKNDRKKINMKAIEYFVGQYPVSKTLRFELKPELLEGQTIEEFWNLYRN